MLRFLLNNGASPSTPDNDSDWTPWHCILWRAKANIGKYFKDVPMEKWADIEMVFPKHDAITLVESKNKPAEALLKKKVPGLGLGAA